MSEVGLLMEVVKKMEGPDVTRKQRLGGAGLAFEAPAEYGDGQDVYPVSLYHKLVLGRLDRLPWKSKCGTD